MQSMALVFVSLYLWFLSTALLHRFPPPPFYCMNKRVVFSLKTPRTVPLTSPSQIFLCKSGNSLSSFLYKLNLLGRLPKQIMIVLPSPKRVNKVLRCQLLTSLQNVKSFPQVLAVFSKDALLYQIPFLKMQLISQSRILPSVPHLPSSKAPHLLQHLRVFRPHCRNFLLIYLPSSLPKHHL